jgi:hypothetical protein
VATPEPVEHSRRLVRAAQAERERLTRDLDQVDQLAERLRASLVEAEARAKTLQRRLDLLSQLGGDKPVSRKIGRDNVVDFPSEPPHGYLRGREIRIAAVRLLTGAIDAAQTIHYSDWFGLLGEAGYGVKGKDPLGTFLTQIGRSPVIVRADEPGTYRLDLDATDQLRERLDGLNDELLALHNGQQTIESIISARERRTELLGTITRVERALEEAIESLGPPPPHHG